MFDAEPLVCRACRCSLFFRGCGATGTNPREEDPSRRTARLFLALPRYLGREQHDRSGVSLRQSALREQTWPFASHAKRIRVQRCMRITIAASPSSSGPSSFTFPISPLPERTSVSDLTYSAGAKEYSWHRRGRDSAARVLGELCSPERGQPGARRSPAGRHVPTTVADNAGVCDAAPALGCGGPGGRGRRKVRSLPPLPRASLAPPVRIPRGKWAATRD